MTAHHLSPSLPTQVDARNSSGRSPLGMAMWAGQTKIVTTLQHEKLQLTDDGEQGQRDDGSRVVSMLE